MHATITAAYWTIAYLAYCRYAAKSEAVEFARPFKERRPLVKDVDLIANRK